MKVRKNFEAIFLVAAVLATLATYASARVPTQRVAAPAAVKAVAAADQQQMQVVVIKGKRLSAAEKAMLN
jgi:predicted cation transporter